MLLFGSHPGDDADPVAVAAATLWSGLSGGTARLINHSENHTYLIETPEGARFALRVHRAGHLAGDAIAAELDWLAAVARDSGVPVVKPLPGRDGNLLQRLPDGRYAVLFEWIAGQEPVADGPLTPLFVTLGRYAALLHRHARSTAPDPRRVRPVWNSASLLERGGAFGDWRQAPGVDAAIRASLEPFVQRLGADLARYGTGADRFGLVHADMRLANLLETPSGLAVLDFDDCGQSWFLYDFGASVSFIEADPRVPELARAWVSGYRTIAPLGAHDIAMLEPMVLLRRMALLAWIGSHGETRLAAAHAPDFAEGTAHLAERYMARPAPERRDPYDCGLEG